MTSHTLNTDMNTFNTLTDSPGINPTSLLHSEQQHQLQLQQQQLQQQQQQLQEESNLLQSNLSMSHSKRFSYLQSNKYYDLRSSNVLDRYTNHSNSNIVPSTLLSIIQRNTIDENKFRSSISQINYNTLERRSNQIFEENNDEFI